MASVSNRRKTLGVLVVEDEVWRYYGDASTVWGPKCSRCRDYVIREGRPAEETLACWKVEVWGRGVLAKFLGPITLEGMAENLALEHSAISKVSKSEIRVERTGIPESGYPSCDIDRLLMLYAETPSQRDAMRRALCDILGLDARFSETIPVRRGCWLYDDILGPWTAWSQDIGPKAVD